MRQLTRWARPVGTSLITARVPHACVNPVLQWEAAVARLECQILDLNPSSLVPKFVLLQWPSSALLPVLQTMRQTARVQQRWDLHLDLSGDRDNTERT